MKDRKGRIRGMKHPRPSDMQWEHILRTSQSGRLTAPQIESARRIIAKRVKKIGTYKIHVIHSTSVTKKPSEVRMGKGKGAIDHYIARVKAGQILLSIQGVSPEIAKSLFEKVQYKLPLQTVINTSIKK
jgi:large subunit ribosomal protein L16